MFTFTLLRVEKSLLLHFFATVTSVGELITATLYPY